MDDAQRVAAKIALGVLAADGFLSRRPGPD
ncbi:hypothetical protein AHiyo1_32040 [Arthrobacter sp. Hiyo1]|nr:hypothetical protein AHiyo1_32040 [Arthrobacter sp. Hiyo1]